jgi:HK97 gp10 family phage protein
MDEISLTFEGLAELDEKLQALSSVARERSLRRAMWPAMAPVLNHAKAGAPRRSGALAVAMARAVQTAGKGRGLSFGGQEKSLVARVVVTPRRNNRQAVALHNIFYSRKRPIRGIYYGHFLEFGTKRGVKPLKFMNRAISSNAQRVINIFAEQLEKAIRTELRRRK